MTPIERMLSAVPLQKTKVRNRWSCLRPFAVLVDKSTIFYNFQPGRQRRADGHEQLT